MLPAVGVPSIDGKGSSFLRYDQPVRPWCRVTKSRASKRAAALILQIGSAARQVRTSAGSEILRSSDGSDQILNISRKYFAPGAADAVFQKAASPLLMEGAGQTMDAFLLEFDVRRRQSGI